MAEIDDLESQIDNLDYRADDLESDIYEVKDGIQRLNEDLNIWGLFDKKMIPYVYKKTLYNILKGLDEKNHKDTFKHFRNLDNEFDIPHLLNTKDYARHKRVSHCTILLKNSKEFFEAGGVASHDTKPIFYYYSITYLFTFLLHSLVHFENHKRHHGIYANTNNGINGIRFNYNEKGGFFERIVHILSLLDYPSSFSSFISSFDSNGQTILIPQKTEISISNKSSILLNKLLEHDFGKDYANLEFKIKHPTLHRRYGKTSAILRDFILIFIASVIARYNPALWRDIYSGENSHLIFHFEKSFNNISDMIRLVNDIITQAEKGTLLIDYTRTFGKFL